MLTGLTIRDVVLVEALDLTFQPGLTALTGETGAGKSIVLDALGMACGDRSDPGLIRDGARQAAAAALFDALAVESARQMLADRGVDLADGEDLILRRQVAADGRSRAWINDQPVGVGVVRDLAAGLIEVHGQHETTGLLDSRTHRGLLDAFGGLTTVREATRDAWRARADARAEATRLAGEAEGAAVEAGAMAEHLADLDRLDPTEGEEAILADRRALLAAAEKTQADLAVARDVMAASSVSGTLSQALRALERSRERAVAAGAGPDSPAVRRLEEAAAALDRALLEADEAGAAVDRAAEAFLFEPDQLERAEERLFALRGMARRLGVAVDDLPAQRLRLRATLDALDSSAERVEAAERNARAADAAYDVAASTLSAARRAAAVRLTEAVLAELPPLKLDKARFAVGVEALPPERVGPDGADRIAFQVATLPGAPLAALDAVASGGELSRLALALKVSLAGAGGVPVMIFDEVDQGVGGAVADAVGQRLKRLARTAQILVVTHSPQIAARADHHWRVSKADADEAVRTRVETLDGDAREEEIARMLSGAEITEAARAAARALLAG